MSAFILDVDHIDLIIDAGVRLEVIPQSNTNAIGQVLLDQNYRSVNYRYDDDRGMAAAEAPRYEFRPFPLAYDRSDVDMAARSYRYQSCETPDWDDLAAARIIGTIIDANERAAREDDPEWVCNDNDSDAWCIYPGMDWRGHTLPARSTK